MERTGLVVLALTGVLIATSGCARLNSIQRNVSLDKTSIAIDAEQRVVISVPAKGSSPQARIVCAEPSPDVFKIRGATFSGLLEKAAKQDLELALSAAEAGQNIGLRTQSIQLLRDAMYRACEGAAGGMLSPTEFGELQTRFQKLTAVLLATEQLTGAVRPVVAPILTTGGSANTGVGLVAIQEELEAARSKEAAQSKAVEEQAGKVQPLKAAADAAEKKLSDAQDPSDEAKKTLEADRDKAQAALKPEQDKLDQAHATLAELTANRLALEQKRQAARSAATTAGGGAVFVAVGDPARQMDPKAAEKVAEVVKEMVIEVFRQDSASQRCLSHFADLSKAAAEKELEAKKVQGQISVNILASAKAQREEALALVAMCNKLIDLESESNKERRTTG